jgi:hypothetical protein
MNYYQRKKQIVRDLAIEWQLSFEKHNYSWSDIADWGSYFERLGRRYGLLREFRENGII